MKGSPAKGKMKEESSWQTGWYDVYPTLERPRRPIEWSNSSMIFTGYGMQPTILARHFSSSKQFMMPLPPPLLSEPENYGPASVISVSPDDSWLFAYFPGQSNAGVCCLWNRGTELDSWRVMDWWTYPAGAGVVVADWIGGPREWTCDPISGSPTRIPSRGPRAPVSNPTLLFVTENHQVICCFVRHYSTAMKMFSCSLLERCRSTESVTKLDQEPTSDINSIHTCLSAAICLNYSDSSILVAMRSQNHPLPVPNHQHDPLELGIPAEADDAGAEALEGVLEDFEEDSIIELCEVQLRFDGVAMSLSTCPLPAIQTAEKKLKDLHFIPHPPTDRTRQSSPTVHLVASFFDFHDYVSLPASEVHCYTFTRQPQDDAVPWIYKQDATRSFEDQQLAFLVPCKHVSGARRITAGLYLKSSAQSPSINIKAKEFVIGTLRVLKLPDLTDDQEWEEALILKSHNRVGQDIPVSAVASPNQSLLCTMSASMWSTQTTLQGLPQLKNQTTPLSLRLVPAILSERAPTDVIHQLSHHSISSNVIANTLNYSFTLLSAHQPKSPRSWLKQVSTSLEVYKMRASKAHDEQEKEDATARWEVAHDICSLVSCNVIFKECRDGEDYNLEAVWELVSLCTWTVACTERILKECVLSLELASSEKASGRVNRPSLLHLVHPQALQTLIEAITNTKRVRQYLGSLTAKAENSQIARDVLIDQVDCSGINLSELLPILGEVYEAVKSTTEEECRRSLAACQPTEDTRKQAHPHLLKILNPKVVDKARLFIKAEDFVDGMSRMTIDSQKQRDRDVVTKALLLMRQSGFRCLRCGGQAAEIGKPDPSKPKIVVLIERYWVRRCICGGFWSRASQTRP
ncbi:pseudouridine synthase pus4 [Marasmius crinis-equi]|uniref:Pseudouridine synthase pus4 n=1 Tax=Marasmius crinis-equi TaxID=585013 RepID=A0ABR3G1K1_9AGAR